MHGLLAVSRTQSKWGPVLVILGALLFGVLDIAFYYNRLPAQVASHFDARGQPDGWSPKGEFVSVLILSQFLVMIALVPMYLSARFAPPSLINLPHKEYWLAAEREPETRRAILRWALWFVAATLWLLSLMFHDAMAANLRQPPRMLLMWWFLGGYLLAVLVLVIRLYARFYRNPHE